MKHLLPVPRKSSRRPALLGVALGAVTWVGAAPAQADTPPAPSASAAEEPEAAPYAPYGDSAFPEPSAVRPEPLPLPMPEEPEFVRRTVELVPHLGFGLAHCADGEASSNRCNGVGGGPALGLTALWRVTPMFAWGGTLSISGFANDPEDEAYSDAQAGAAFIGLTGRVYFTEEGRFEPYVELGVGGGALGTQQEEPNPAGGRAAYEETGAGPAVRAYIGFDLHLTRSLRLGPSVGLTRVFVDKIRRCRNTGSGDCQDQAPETNGHLDSYLQVLANLTFQFGSEL